MSKGGIYNHIRTAADKMEWRRIKMEKAALQDHKCFWCGILFDDENPMTGDHIVELAAGGAVLDPKNIVAACDYCNQARSYGLLTFIAHVRKP